jgi:DNA-binding MarR family transcriptional regulator
MLRLALAVTVHAGNAAERALTPTQIRVLTLLAAADEQGMNLSAIAECLSVSGSSASRLCQRLIRDGLVARHAGPGHHILISLSPAGVKTLTALNRQRLALVRAMIEQLPPRPRATVTRAVEDLSRHAVDNLDIW